MAGGGKPSFPTRAGGPGAPGHGYGPGGGGGGPKGPGSGSGAENPAHSAYEDGTIVFKKQKPPRLSPGPDPDASGAHTRLRWDHVNNRVYQGREIDAGGNPKRDIDFTTRTYPNGRLRRDHLPPPHQHRWILNDPVRGPKGGFKRLTPEPLN